MRNNLLRSLQGAIIFLIVVGLIALALGGYFRPVSNLLGQSLTSVQSWISVRFLAIQDFFTAPRDLAALRQRNAELESEIYRLQTQLIESQQKRVRDLPLGEGLERVADAVRDWSDGGLRDDVSLLEIERTEPRSGVEFSRGPEAAW